MGGCLGWMLYRNMYVLCDGKQKKTGRATKICRLRLIRITTVHAVRPNAAVSFLGYYIGHSLYKIFMSFVCICN